MSAYKKTLKKGIDTIYPQTVDEAVFTKNGSSTLDKDLESIESRHIAMTEAEYNALETKDPNVYYYLYED